MRFTDLLRQEAGPIWEAEKRHPFVRGIGDGSLPLDRFQFYLVQDYLFLIEFSRIFALGAARAADLATMQRFASLLHETLHTEMALHKRYGERFGIPPAQMEAAEPAPTTIAYTRYILEAAWRGTTADLAAAMLPCQWGYAEIGRHLKATGDTSEANPYRDWILLYSSEEFKATGDWLREHLDRAAAESGPGDRERWRTLFLTGSRYEYLFWEMAWRQERWPV